MLSSLRNHECCARSLRTRRPVRGAIWACPACGSAWTYVKTSEWQAWMRWSDVKTKPEIMDMDKSALDAFGGAIVATIAIVLAIMAIVVGCGCGSITSERTANDAFTSDGNGVGDSGRESSGGDIHQAMDSDDGSTGGIEAGNGSNDASGDVGNDGGGPACAERGPVCYACRKPVGCAGGSGPFVCCGPGDVIACDLTWCRQ